MKAGSDLPIFIAPVAVLCGQTEASSSSLVLLFACNHGRPGLESAIKIGKATNRRHRGRCSSFGAH